MSKTMCQEQYALWEYGCIQNCEGTTKVLLNDDNVWLQSGMTQGLVVGLKKMDYMVL